MCVTANYFDTFDEVIKEESDKTYYGLNLQQAFHVMKLCREYAEDKGMNVRFTISHC